MDSQSEFTVGVCVYVCVSKILIFAYVLSFSLNSSILPQYSTSALLYARYKAYMHNQHIYVWLLFYLLVAAFLSSIC